MTMITKGNQAVEFVRVDEETMDIRYYHTGIVSGENRESIAQARETYRTLVSVNGFNPKPSSLDLRAAGIVRVNASTTGVGGTREKVQRPTHSWAERNLR